MADLDPALEALARLHRLQAEPETTQATVDRLVAVAVDAVPGCDRASITAAADRPTTIAHLGAGTEQIDNAQYDHGGPCVHAYKNNETVSIPDITNDTRWPSFARTALYNGVRSSQSHPLVVD